MIVLYWVVAFVIVFVLGLIYIRRLDKEVKRLIVRQSDAHVDHVRGIQETYDRRLAAYIKRIEELEEAARQKEADRQTPEEPCRYPDCITDTESEYIACPRLITGDCRGPKS
jgi:hypothetical protein